MSDTGTGGEAVTFDVLWGNVTAVFQAARDALAATDARLREELGGPDPDMSARNAEVVAVLDEFRAIAPADVGIGEPVVTEPLPEVPAPV